MKKAIALIFMFICFLNVGGCSVYMAAVGQKEPDLSVVRTGASRGEIELQLGKPIQTASWQEGRLDIYEYELGNEPSAGRATAHAVMDVLTLGIWEIVGTPLEAAQGKKHQLKIYYDTFDKVLSINQPPYGLAEPTALSEPANKESETEVEHTGGG